MTSIDTLNNSIKLKQEKREREKKERERERKRQGRRRKGREKKGRIFLPRHITEKLPDNKDK